MNHLMHFRPRPQPDELLTSWLSRLALENGTTVVRLLATLKPNTNASMLDLDLYLPEWLLSRLAERTGLSSEAVHGTTLTALHGLYVGEGRPYLNSSWFMPLDTKRQHVRLRGQQVCPDCLASDPVPYYRRHWRLSFVTTCPVHQCLLLDSCPSCESPVDFRWACESRGELSDDDALCRCGYCSVDFRTFAWANIAPEVTVKERRDAWGDDYATGVRRAPKIPQEVKLITVTNWQRGITDSAESGTVLVGGECAEVGTYLRGCRHLLNLLTTDRAAGRFRTYVSARTSYPLPPLAQTLHSRFERSAVETRYGNLLLLTWLLFDWPSRFLETCQETDVPQKALFRHVDLTDGLTWYEQQCLAYLTVQRAGEQNKSGLV